MAVEWDTLLFFAALFVVVEGVSEMGLLRFIANTLSVLISPLLPATVAVAGVATAAVAGVATFAGVACLAANSD